ncbi:MAG: metallophosphoesterase [Bacteroidia bacterium]|nr:metallophosphoesterase [Bacteroidia bacterium]
MSRVVCAASQTAPFSIATAPPVNIVRGPYLQIGTANSMILKWRTDVNCDSKVWYGTSISTITNQVSNASLITDHEIKITGLNPSTLYYYMIGTSTATLLSASSGQTFKTSPVIGSKGKYKFWVIGDAGTGNTNAKTGFLNYVGNNHIDGWLWLGDNAYNGGYDSEYQISVFANGLYATELKKFVVWPAPGNHDYNNNIPFSPPPAYLDIFTLPTLGEAGGLASGTEKYYSYNYGNIHFVVLDSYSVGRGTTDPMAVWLQNDLAANTLPWVIAYWHHPPYTKGSHNSDNPNFLDGELPEIRQNIIPILENNGVDLVLNGHSHCYERSFLVDGHYGTSSQLNASMIKDNTSGNFPSSCPYQKQTLINKAHKGAVYSVVGCSGQTSGTSSGWPHPVFYSYSNTLLGSMLIEVNDNRLDAKFITSTNSIYDGFTIVKNAGKKTTLTICQGQSAILKPSWPQPVFWFPLGTTLDSAIVSPPFSTTYFAYDPSSCIKDTFVVNVTPNNIPPCNITSLPNYDPASEVSVYPTLIKNKDEVFVIRTFSGSKIEPIKMLDLQGRTIEVYANEISVNEVKVHFKNEPTNGIYFLEIMIDNKTIHKKIIFNK